MEPEFASSPETWVSLSRKRKNAEWNDLVGTRSADVRPENNGKLAAAIGGGIAASLGLIIVAFGIRPDLADPDVLAFVVAKLVFSLIPVGLSSIFLTNLIRSGGGSRSTIVLPTLAFLGVTILAVLSMFADPGWDEMIRRGRWLECAVSVPIITIVPFAAIMCAVRIAAPVNLTRAGALAGLAASGVSVIAYALHCPIDPAPFAALWFGGTSISCMLSGAKLGPRLLCR